MNYKDLVYRAVTGLKNIGGFAHKCGDDPHPLDCTLAGRVSHVFGVGMTIAIEICRDVGQDPEFSNSPTGFRPPLHSRVRIRFGPDRGHYGTVVHIGGDNNDYFGVKLDCHQNPAGYKAVTKQSECIEFYDAKEGQWYEIVVRAIDLPCEDSAAKLDNERAFAKGAREFDVRHPDDCKSECFWTEARYGMKCPQGGCDGIRITK